MMLGGFEEHDCLQISKSQLASCTVGRDIRITSRSTVHRIKALTGLEPSFDCRQMRWPIGMKFELHSKE